MIQFDEYARTSYEPEKEFVDGRLVDRHVREYRHSRAQGLIAAAVGQRESHGLRTLIAFRVRTGEARVRVPDVCVLAASSNALSPHLAIEVVAPCEDLDALRGKLADYHQGGIPHVWIVDPYKRTLIESMNGILKRPESSVLSTPLVGDVDFADLFAQLDEPAE